MIMRSIKTTSGTEIVLDGDLLAVLEALYHEVTAKNELDRSFEDMSREINHLIDQLTDEERVQLELGQHFDDVGSQATIGRVMDERPFIEIFLPVLFCALEILVDFLDRFHSR